jgi:hypothetical protein
MEGGRILPSGVYAPVHEMSGGGGIVEELTIPWRCLEIWVPGHPPGGNAIHRMHHFQVRKSRAEWKDRTLDALQIAGIGPLGRRIEKCHLVVRWQFRVRRTRDYDNLIAGLKPILDGLVDGGILVGDSTDHVLAIMGSVSVDKKGEDGILLRLEEVPG